MNVTVFKGMGLQDIRYDSSHFLAFFSTLSLRVYVSITKNLLWNFQGKIKVVQSMVAIFFA